MRDIDGYVDEVMGHVPLPAPGSDRIEADVRTHLQERVDAGEPVEEAVSQMGRPEEVAAAYLAEVHSQEADFSDRVFAFLIDWVLGLLLFGGAGLALATFTLASRGGEWAQGGVMGTALLVVFGASGVILAVLYFPVLEARFGQTLGKRLLGIYVARADGTSVSLGRAFVRRLPLFFEFFVLDALVAPFTDRKQRAFDLVADTVVLEASSSKGGSGGR